MTLRGRLTLGYSLLLAVVIVLFGGLVFLSFSLSMTAQIEETLIRTGDDILRAIQKPETFEITLRGVDLTSNVFVQVWSPDQELLWQSANLPRVSEGFDPSSLEVTENTFSSRFVDSTHLRVLTVPVLDPIQNRVELYLQLAASLDPVDRAKDSLLILLVGGGVFAIAVAGVVGWGTAKAALKPLDGMTETALQITRADDLSRRIPLSSPPSGEIGRLILAFNETLERLENLFEGQKRFLADVSHELRTPLTAIRGNVDLIRRFGRSDEESLEAITSEVDRMTRMVQDLLLLAKAESGNLPMAREMVELDTLMLEVYQQAKVLAQGRVEIRLGDEDQARVLGDGDRLKQVLLNLVANALEHTPDGGRVTLSLACSDESARLSVGDTGSGIPQEELSRIFARFYRLDRSRKRSGEGGTGLGLSIAYWIVRSHGGEIEVASQMGQGTSFTVILPRVEEDCSRRAEQIELVQSPKLERLEEPPRSPPRKGD